MKKYKEVGSFEAKTHLSELLADAYKGMCITITKRGFPIAQLGPCAKAVAGNRAQALARFLAIRNTQKTTADIKSFINEGRKH